MAVSCHRAPSAWKSVYPRGCGGTSSFRYLYPRGCGGTRPIEGGRTLRSIPAGAGEPRKSASPRRASSAAVYPRGCGGTWVAIKSGRLCIYVGLSPRVRGNRSIAEGLTVVHRLGSIPAGAGEPSLRCSGTEESIGLSPRVRGNRKRQTRYDEVYPRGCGGTIHATIYGDEASGSIPAGAGEPVRITVVHMANQGLSPRVRGNQGRQNSSTAPEEVYPRGCGGTPNDFRNSR